METINVDLDITDPLWTKYFLFKRLFVVIRVFYPRAGQSFTANSGTKAAVLPKGRSGNANSGTKVADLLGINTCCRFP